MQDSTAAAEQDFAALFERGNRLHKQADFTAAAATFKLCLDLAPGRSEVLFNLGNALLSAGKPREAANHLFRCTQITPGFGDAYVNLAYCLLDLGQPTPARTVAEIAVTLMPGGLTAQRCLAIAFHHEGDFERAASVYRLVLESEPDDHATLTNLGNTLHCLGDLPGALACHDRALAIRPDAQIRFNRAVALLAAGAFGEGWKEYEARWHLPAQSLGCDLGPAWQGEPLDGRTILLHAEQGFGDTLQFARYAPVVASRGGRVVLQVQPELSRLMHSLRGVAAVAGRGEPLPHFDTHCPLMSLPHACGTVLDTVPAETPYLSAEPERVAFWNKRLPGRTKLRVGLVWAGRPAGSRGRGVLPDRRRSMSLTDLLPLADIKGVQFIKLQKQTDEPLMSVLPDAFDPMAEVGDFAETAAIMSNLDLILSVDTSTAHLAGALGRPVWMLSRFDGCWRWLAGRDDSPWYPTMRIFRQPRPSDWHSVVARVRSELEALARS